MDLDFLGAVVFRWLHILAAITAVGGAIFMRMALLPAVATLPEREREKFAEDVRSRWAKFVMAAILFLLISGFYNYFRYHFMYNLPGPYQMLFGIKFLLALAIFFLASVLSGRSEATQFFRDDPQRWLSLNVVLAVAIVCISGLMKNMDHGTAKDAKKPAQSAHATGNESGRVT